MGLIRFIWPHVGTFPPDSKLEIDLNKIRDANWEGDTASFLDEARRLRDIETARKSSAETKSQIYLAALFALIPILVSLTEHKALKGIVEFDEWYQIAGFILFVVGLLYGVGAFVSSFRALAVRAYNRVDVDDIVKASSRKDLTKEILKSVRLDRLSVNHKISFVIVTHELVFRMALCQLSALALIVFSPYVGNLFSYLKTAMFE